MNLTHLQSFLKVAQLGGFSAAAEVLDVSKGMVSRHIGSLEESLQCKLFNRTTRRVTLTEPGKELLEKALQIESIAGQAQQNIHNLTQETTGTLKFTAPGELGRVVCKEVIQDFMTQYPKVNLSLSFSRQIKDVEFGEFDVALRAYEQVPDNLVAKNFGYAKNIIVASPQWLENNPISNVNELQNVNCIQDNYRSHWNRWELVTKDGEKMFIQTNSNLACSDYIDTRLLATLGLGVANLPRYVVEDELRQKRLVQLFPSWYSNVHRLHLIYAKQRYYPKKIRGFIDLILQWREMHPHWFEEE